MKQDEKWLAHYQEVKNFIETNHRNPSRHKIEEHDVHTEIHFSPCWMYNPLLNRRLQQWFESQKEAQMATFDSEFGFACSSARLLRCFSIVHTYLHS